MKNRKVNKNMVERIKDRVSKSGKGFGAFLFIPKDGKVKVRFISELDQAVPVSEHDKWPDVMPTPCIAEHYNKECRLCEDKTIRVREVYCWTVWDYNAKEKKLVKFAANSYTPTPQLISAFETYGTLIDRDYVISRSGEGTNTTYGVMPLDKEKFSKKLRPFTAEEVLEKCVEACDEYELEDIEEMPDVSEYDDDEEEEFEDEEELEDDDEYEEDDEEEDDDEFDEDDDEYEDDDEPFEDDEPVKKKKRK